MNSTPDGTKLKNNKESIKTITINKLMPPNNVQLKKFHYYSQSQQILDQQIDENVFFIPKYSLRRVKYSEQNIITSQTVEKSLQTQLINKFLQENSIQLHQIQPIRQMGINELVQSSKCNKKIKKQGNLNTEPNQNKQTLPSMYQGKSKQAIADLYKFTFYSPKTEENKIRLPKEFQIQPCSKKKYFI